MRRVTCIANPASAGGKGRQRLDEVMPRLEAVVPDVVVRETEGPGHATVLTRDALVRGADLVISVGGDGTLNEVLAGFVDEAGDNMFPKAELGLVACGTGCDFQRHLGLQGVPQQVDAVLAGPAVPIDYGVASLISRDGQPLVRPFLNEASVGLSGHVVDTVRRTPRLLGPQATYLVSTVRSLLAYRDKGVTLVLDDDVPRELPLTLAVVANGQYFGGGMWIAPEASCDDGWFDVLYTGGGSKLQFAGLMAKVFRGRHTQAPTVRTARSRTIRMLPRDDRDVVLIDLDGEQPGRLPASFSIVPRGIRVRAAGLAARETPASTGQFEQTRSDRPPPRLLH